MLWLSFGGMLSFRAFYSRYIGISFGLVASEGKGKRKRWNQLYLFAFIALLAPCEECCCSLCFGEDLREIA